MGKIDGVDLWKALSEDLASERTDVLHNIDDIYGNAALTVGEWKIVKGMVIFQNNTVNFIKSWNDLVSLFSRLPEDYLSLLTAFAPAKKSS